jgi:hypothetical protein
MDFDDDDLLVDSDEDDIRNDQRASLQSRLDQYLNASKLGRMAYEAGDVKLATDRFNLALDMELQLEVESFNDFGLTGQLLREELAKRKLTFVSAEEDDKPCRKILRNLRSVYERANASSMSNPTDPRRYLEMGSALCLINEWDKAGKVYEEGLMYCPQNKDLLKAIQSLSKLEDMLKLLCTDSSSDVKRRPSGSNSPTMKRKKRPASTAIDLPPQTFEELEDEEKYRKHQAVPRSSSSFAIEDEVFMKKMRHPTISPLARVAMTQSSGYSSLSARPEQKRNSIFGMFKSRKPSSSMDFADSLSLSADNKMFANSKMRTSSISEDHERTNWKVFFTTSSWGKKMKSEFGSRTIDNMRAINALTPNEI